MRPPGGPLDACDGYSAAIRAASLPESILLFPPRLWPPMIALGQTEPVLLAMSDTKQYETTTIWEWISRILLALLVLVLVFRIADRLARRSDPLPTIPQPNGYDALLAIAREARAPRSDLADLDPQAIRQIGQANRQTLQRVPEALNAETGVPLRVEPRWGDKHAEDVKQLKRLAVLLGLQSRAELLDGRTNNSAKCLVEVILLGQAMARGGLFSDSVNALTIETLGTASLRAQVPHLDAESCRSAAQELERSEPRRELPERTRKTQKDWSAASFGLVGRVGSFFLRKAEAQRHTEFLRRNQDVVRRTRRLMLILAARAIELETGKRVSSPSALVPDVLSSVPLDPETHTPMTEMPFAPNEP
jgi:hypothetical protein